MSTIVRLKQPIPSGTFDARVSGVRFAQTGGRTYLRWEFAVNVNGEERRVVAATSPDLTETNKPGRWLKAVLGYYPKDEQFDLESIVGRRCVVELVHVKTSEGRLVTRVDKVLPPREGEIVL